LITIIILVQFFYFKREYSAYVLVSWRGCKWGRDRDRIVSEKVQEGQKVKNFRTGSTHKWGNGLLQQLASWNTTLTRLFLKMLICLAQICVLEMIKEDLSVHKPFGVSPNLSLEEAKVWGLKQALLWLMGLGYTRVSVELDCKSFMDGMKDNPIFSAILCVCKKKINISKPLIKSNGNFLMFHWWGT